MSDGELAKVIGQGQMGTANEQGQIDKGKWTRANGHGQMGKAH